MVRFQCNEAMMKPVSKETKQFREYISEVAFQLRTEFFLGEYDLDFEWNEDVTENPKGDTRIGLAQVEVDSVYLNITLSIYEPLFKMWQDNDLERIWKTLVHEFCHILVIPLFKELQMESHPQVTSFIEDIHERQTQRIANVLLFSNLKSIPWKKKLLKGKKR